MKNIRIKIPTELYILNFIRHFSYVGYLLWTTQQKLSIRHELFENFKIIQAISEFQKLTTKYFSTNFQAKLSLKGHMLYFCAHYTFWTLKLKSAGKWGK